MVKMFAKKPNVKQIPPTNEALDQHVKRVTYQGGQILGQLLLVATTLPLPTMQLEMEKNKDGVYESNWTRHQNSTVS